mgnify:CR=1 FL=1
MIKDTANTTSLTTTEVVLVSTDKAMKVATIANTMVIAATSSTITETTKEMRIQERNDNR